MEEIFEVAMEGHEPTTSVPEAEKEVSQPKITEIPANSGSFEIIRSNESSEVLKDYFW